MKKVKILKFEQNCISIELSETEYYVFDTGSETSMEKLLENKVPTATFVSHSHPDHFNVDNIKKLDCSVYGSKEVVQGLANENVNATELLPNTTISIGKIKVTPFNVDHGPISTPIVNLGFHIIADQVSILFLGDIALPSELPNAQFDVIFIPVGGSKVFDIHQALDFLKSNNFNQMVIPMHYHGRADRTSGKQFQDIAKDFCDVRVLDVGEYLTF